ncbi:MAG: hypothetical protein AAF710_00100 [Planctomycetota bacterium]
MTANPSPPNTAKPGPAEPEDLGQTGIVFADLAGYSQLVYQVVHDEPRRNRLALAMQRLLHHDPAEHPHVTIEGYAGDGFLALVQHNQPTAAAHRFALSLHDRFQHSVRSLLLDLGFRADVRLRTALHCGPVYRLPLDTPDDQPPRSVVLSDAVVIAARIAASQTCRRFGSALSLNAYKRLLRLGGQPARDPDEVIQDRNQYPEPIPVYRLRPGESPAP